MRKKRRHIHRIFYLLGIALIFLSGFIWWQRNIQPIQNNSNVYKDFTIEKGESLRNIAQNLKKEGLIRDIYAFLLVTKLLHIDSSIQAGEFELSPSMDTFSIARNLTRSTSDIRVTFPEGKRAEETAEILAEHIPTFLPQETADKLLEHEGYLFPDTYSFTKDTSIDDIISEMRENFEKKYSTLNINSNLTKNEIVIIASLIEREARHNEDRPIVASVIYNRYSIGMKLDIDATVQYALGYNYNTKTWWKNGLTLDDLTINSPYNTYINPGLPPAPIANPGLAALQAAANPAETEYLYYITDKDGINHYAKTLSEHNANIKKYGL